MPVLKNESKIERFYLPSTKALPETEQAFVDMEVGPMTTGDIIGINAKAGEVEMGVRMLTARIKGWNIQDAAGNDLEIDFDNVCKLPIEDFTYLADKLPQDVEPLGEAEKKT